jgi:hypothetical protein
METLDSLGNENLSTLKEKKSAVADKDDEFHLL